MKKVFAFTSLLLLGLIISQTALPSLKENFTWMGESITILTHIGLAFIMFFVGLEFNLKKNELHTYKRDYIVAFTAATFPWIFTSVYLLMTHFPAASWTSMESWKEVLFVGRFAAPTSAGILFTMLAAAGLAGTWIFKKIRILAIFDDLDTVLLLIPLKLMVIGMAWQLGVVLIIMVGLCLLGWFYLRKLDLPLHGYYPLLYSISLAGICHTLYLISKAYDPTVPIHIEVLFPAFILGMMVSMNRNKHKHVYKQEFNLTLIGGAFMMLVGLNMPYIMNQFEGYTANNWWTLGFHVLMVTLVSNIGKLYVLFNYQDEATFRERLAVGIGMLPRGEVGAGVLVMAIGLGFSGPLLTVAMASLVLNLLLTGFFIYLVKYLSQPTATERALAQIDIPIPSRRRVLTN